MRVCFLLLFWSVTLPLLYHLTDSANVAVECCYVEDVHFPTISNTEFGAFAIAYYNPEHGYRPEYGVRFEKLNVSKRSVSFLRTAMHQNLQLEQLSLILFSYTQDHMKNSNDTEEGSKPYNDNLGFTSPLNTISTLLLSKHRLSPNSNTQIHFPDISKTTQISISDFSVNWKIDSQSGLTIQSRRAILAVQQPHEVQLLGHVILETPNGKLQANRVVWDTEKEIFHIPGRYHYSAPQVTFSGQNDSMDYRLNILANSNFTDTPIGGSLWSANE